MFNTVSKGGVATWIFLIGGILKILGVEVEEGTIESIAYGIVNLIAVVLLVLCTFSREDLKAGIIRK